MELEFIMDGGADALNGTIWFPNTPSPPYEQLSPVRQNRRDPIATQHVSFLSVLLPQIIVSSLVGTRVGTATLHDVSTRIHELRKEGKVSSRIVGIIQRYQPISLLCSRALYSCGCKTRTSLRRFVCATRVSKFHLVVISWWPFETRSVKQRAIRPVN